MTVTPVPRVSFSATASLNDNTYAFVAYTHGHQRPGLERRRRHDVEHTARSNASACRQVRTGQAGERCGCIDRLSELGLVGLGERRPVGKAHVVHEDVDVGRLDFEFFRASRSARSTATTRRLEVPRRVH